MKKLALLITLIGGSTLAIAQVSATLPPVIDPLPPALGGQTDAHGCLTGAGYSWNATASQCLRRFEDNRQIIQAAARARREARGFGVRK